MLTQLQIHGFSIIDQLTLDFEKNMSAITGESGAGKSILIGALSLVLGERANNTIIRPGCDRCDITATFAIDQSPRILAWLEENALNHDENECFLRRVVQANGRSQALINNQRVPLQTLKDLATQLINIHSQHQHQHLLRHDTQRHMLDTYAQLEPQQQKVQTLFDEWHRVKVRLDQLKEQQNQQDRLELLRFQLQELTDAAPQPGETEKLHQEQKQLSHANDHQDVLAQAETLLTQQDGSALELLQHARDQLAKHPLSSTFTSTLGLLDSAIINTQEACDDIQNQQQGITMDPARLQAVETRLSRLHELARKHRIEPEELFSHQEKLQTTLDELEHGEELEKTLEAELQTLAESYEAKAKKLSAARKKSSKKLAQQITEQMQQLHMPGGQFDIQITSLDHFTPHGLDQIEFIVTANPGHPLQALHKVASGGELSRISLAIHTLTARNFQTPILVFDEVDTGIGGATAERVGQCLAKLGNEAQVICITHLPQVACHAKHHYCVKKHSDKKQTSSTIEKLSEQARIQEISRMLGGTKITAQTRAHAEELLAQT